MKNTPHTVRRAMLCALLALTVLVSALPLGVIAAHADDEAEEVTVEKKEVNAYVYSLENTKTFECLFRSDLPDVPYIDVIDYLNVIYTDEFTESANEDGTFTVTNVNGYTMVVDPGNDTVFFENYDEFISCETSQEGSSLNIDYLLYKDGAFTVEPQAVTIDFGSYHVDLIGQDGKVYLPLTVVAAMFSIAYNNAVYLDGDICFVHTSDPESYINEADFSSCYATLTRSKEEAEFTYYTLCLFIDKFYGRPSNALISSALEGRTLDEALDVFDENTPLIKQLLLSENKSEYFSGLCMLSYYLYDGGHTVLYYPPVIGVNIYGDLPLSETWYKDICTDNDLSNLVWAFLDAQFGAYDLYGVVPIQRQEAYKKYEDEIVKSWESGAYLIVHGRTAVFVFDSFDARTPDDFKEALDLAKEKNVKSFIIDDSCNGGGFVAANYYICTMISNAGSRSAEFRDTNMTTVTGAIYESVYQIDLNLDGNFDDLDKDVYYDFHFAVLTSALAFSCGNALPVFAGELGVMVLGEPSGGGSCNVTERYLADGNMFPISDINKTVLPDGKDVDLGAKVDVYLTKENEDGTADYSGYYDIDRLGALVEEFYGAEPVETGVSPLPVILLIASLSALAAVVIFRRRKAMIADNL